MSSRRDLSDRHPKKYETNYARQRHFVTRDKGIGSLMLRMLSFKKENHITGHDVKFYIFLKYNETLKNYLVVYKLEPEGDTAGKDQTRVETKPLGPLQEPFEIFKGRMAPN